MQCEGIIYCGLAELNNYIIYLSWVCFFFFFLTTFDFQSELFTAGEYLVDVCIKLLDVTPTPHS